MHVEEGYYLFFMAESGMVAMVALADSGLGVLD